MFKKLNETFTCLNCGKTVLPHRTSSRDHCNYCLVGMHVDIDPGDRMNLCQGTLVPIGLLIKNGKRQIVYKCKKCNEQVKCIVAPDDSFEEILKLSLKKYEDR